MTNELQTDAPDGITFDNESEETNIEASETDKGGAELATAAGETQSKNNDGLTNQDDPNGYKKSINKQHAKFREQERRADGLDEQLAKANEKLSAFEAEKKEVIVPDMPDSFDENFEERMKLRDEAIRRQATQDAQKNVALDQQNAQKEAAGKTEKDRVDSLITDYTGRITTLGLSADDIRIAGETVVRNGIDGQVAEYILADEDGPLITKYLADNPIIQDEIRGLSTIQAAMKINSEIRQAASVNKPQASLTPDPAETLNGRGVGEPKSPLLKGVTFT